MKIRRNLVIGTFILSFVLLGFFSIMQASYPNFLWLEPKWIIVSGIPLLIGVLYSGILKTFKGFGIELETNLSEKIGLNLVGEVEIFPSSDLPKDTASVLEKISLENKLKTERLQFEINKQDYYKSYTVLEYINQLPNVKYIEIVDNQKKFVALLQASKFLAINQNSEIYNRNIELLIKSIEVGNISDNFNDLITHTINKEDSLLQALKKFNDSVQGKSLDGDQKLPVIDSNGRMIGLTRRFKLTEKIAEQVLKTEK